MHEPAPGVFVFDMGTVMTGWAALRIPQGMAGDTVALKYSELLFDSGMIRPKMTSGCRQADLYTMKGVANESYEPRFTYHGFRYVEVTGFPGRPDLDTLEACFVHNGVEQAGTFEGHDEDARAYRDLAGRIKEAFHEAFFDAAGGYYDIGCQSVQALAIAFSLVPETHRDRLIGYLNSSVNFRQKRITSGYAGTKWVVEAVAKSGRNDIIWNRAIATDYPSWGYMLRGDKTTITENWSGGASQCHTTLGAAIDEWFYWGLAGIRPDESAPGYKKIIIKPYLPADLPWAKASLQTPRGTISSNWQHDGEMAALRIQVPANSTADVHIPTAEAESVK